MRKRIIVGGAVAVLAGATAALALGRSVISEIAYQDDVAVTAESLKCVFTPGHDGGYIPRDTAWANLVTSEDGRSVFRHENAGVTTSVNARGLCNSVAGVLQDAAANGGKVPAQKKVVLAIVKQRNGYTDHCYRYLQETLTVTLPRGVTLTSSEYRQLSDAPNNDCN